MNPWWLRILRMGSISRIAIGVAALLTMLMMLLDLALGLVPDKAQQSLARRQLAAELLAERVATIASTQGLLEVQKGLQQARREDPLMLSAALRRADGSVVAVTGDHGEGWGAVAAEPTRDGSRLLVPIRAQGQPWGRLELRYEAATAWSAWLNLRTLWPALVFMGSVLLLRLYLGRVLTMLDPSNAVPERVRAAYNALNEAVAITDAQGRLMLVNHAFVKFFAPNVAQLGRPLEEHAWLRQGVRFDDGKLPWRTALQTGHFIGDRRMVLAASVQANAPGAAAPDDKAPEAKASEASARVALVDCTPIQDDRERVQGCLIVFQDQTAIERANQDLAQTLGELRVAHAQISQQHEEMTRLATQDPLTGCLNRRSFFEKAPPQMQRCIEAGSAAAIIMADIDHFKSFNDRYGHAVGDDVIRAVSRLLREGVGEQGLVCRYGGEEFCILLPSFEAARGQNLADRLRLSIQNEAGQSIRDMNLSITISLGLAVNHDAGTGLEAVIEAADQALYQSKRNGRNRVTLAEAVAPAEAVASAA